MIYLETKLHAFLSKYPALKEGLPLCGCAEGYLQPFISHKSLGLTCRECDAATWFNKDPQVNREVLNTIFPS